MTYKDLHLIKTLSKLYHIFHIQQSVGWLLRFNVGLELRSGLMPMVWDSTLRTVRRHAITILIFHVGDGSPALVPPKV